MYFTLFYFYKFNLNTVRFITVFLNTHNKNIKELILNYYFFFINYILNKKKYSNLIIV